MGAVAANRQNIFDWWRLRDYQTPPPVAQLADQDSMTTYGRKIFYVNYPTIADKQTFNINCGEAGKQHEETIVLGCYHGNQRGIYLLGVTDKRLDGVEQVTAAHEMLHAAYDRLSSKDRQKVDDLLLEYYHGSLKDKRVLDTIEAYKKSEPNDIVNEMHSVFGTEISNLPVALEEYYKRYFTDRSKIAGFASQYQAVFTSRQMALERDEALLNDLKSQITNAEAELKAERASVDSLQAALLIQRNSGNVSAYNAGVPGYNKAVSDYNSHIESLRDLIERYNSLVAHHNTLVAEQGQLKDELDAKAPNIKQ